MFKRIRIFILSKLILFWGFLKGDHRQVDLDFVNGRFVAFNVNPKRIYRFNGQDVIDLVDTLNQIPELLEKEGIRLIMDSKDELDG